MQVMIIEDEQDILLLYRDYLEKKGHSVVVTSTIADEALLDYKMYVPDLVIIDYKLPGKIDGIKAAKEILIQNQTARILLVTAFESIKKQIESDNFFVGKKIRFLLKPVRLPNLSKAIQEITRD
jgi:DNA-binding response OmpR family regulator